MVHPQLKSNTIDVVQKRGVGGDKMQNFTKLGPSIIISGLKCDILNFQDYVLSFFKFYKSIRYDPPPFPTPPPARKLSYSIVLKRMKFLVSLYPKIFLGLENFRFLQVFSTLPLIFLDLVNLDVLSENSNLLNLL